MITLLRQLAYALANISGVALLCFVVLYLAGGFPNLTAIESLGQFLRSILTGDFGHTAEGLSVFAEILHRFPATIELWISAFTVGILIGLPLGVSAATHPDRWQSKWTEGFTLLGFSLPVFWLAMLLVLWLSVELGLTPVSERIGFLYDVPPVSGFILLDSLLAYPVYGFSAFWNASLHLLLPVVTLAILPTAIAARITKTALRHVLGSDYIRMAKGQGISARSLVWKHGLANVAAPLLQILTLQLSAMFTGVFLVETLFSWPGVSAWLLERLAAGDKPAVVMGGFLMACFLMLMNALMDGLSLAANPRARRSRT